jgi:ankyrin repeat protein
MRPGFPFFLQLFKTTILKQPRRMGKTLYELVFLASADFLQPIWNASLAFLGLSAVLLLIDLTAIYRKKKKEGDIPVDFSKFEELQKRFGEMELRGMFMASVAFLLSIVIVCVQLFPPFKEKGITAALVPGIEGVQKTLLRIDANVSDIKAQMKNIKQETSTNPREQLQNLGTAWTEDNFLDAVKSGDTAVVRLFLLGGMHPETANDKGRPLPIMLALNKFNPDLVLDLLVSNGLAINRQYEYSGGMGKLQGTLLGSAIERGNTELVRALLQKKVDVNGAFQTFGAFGVGISTEPLSASIYWKRIDITKLLLDAGANPAANNYAPYTEAQRDLASSGWRYGTDTAALINLLPKLRPEGASGDRADAALQLEGVKRKLNEVAMKSLQAGGMSSEKARYDREYDSLQVIKKRLEAVLGKP